VEPEALHFDCRSERGVSRVHNNHKSPPHIHTKNSTYAIPALRTTVSPPNIGICTGTANSGSFKKNLRQPLTECGEDVPSLAPATIPETPPAHLYTDHVVTLRLHKHDGIRRDDKQVANSPPHISPTTVPPTTVPPTTVPPIPRRQ
jgi:hypothetical protein